MNFTHSLAEAIKNALGGEILIDEIVKAIEVPPNPAMGDFAFPCFKLAKAMRKAPPQIANDISEKLEKPSFVERLSVEGAYLNFFVSKEQYAKKAFGDVLANADGYGKSNVGGGKAIPIDYSSPNIAKPFHVGHLRSTVIGNALYKMYNYLGYKAIGINHLGDWGTQFGKLIVAYKNWGEEQAVNEKGISELTRLYVKFHDAAEEDDSLNDQARAWFVKMQDGDSEALALWKWFNDISLAEFNRVYKLLGIEFDYYTGESFYNDKMDAVVDELREKSLLEKSEGAMIVNLEQFNMPPCLILRSDGGTLYPTRDIAAAFYRKHTFGFHKALYITAMDQNLHFAQWFKVIERMGYDWSKDLVHIPFGLVSFETGKLSTRKGNVVLMEDLLNEAVQKTLEIINEKNPELLDKETVAKQVGYGAIIFHDLFNSRIKDVVFSWEKVLNFEGETGPYVQYAHARACAVLEKAGSVKFDNTNYAVLSDEATAAVAKLIIGFPEKIAEAAEKYEPFVLSRHLVSLAQAFNRFYHDNEVLTASEDVKNARLLVVHCVKNVLKQGLWLLGIHAPEKM